MQALEELLNCYFVVNKRISYALSMQNKKIIKVTGLELPSQIKTWEKNKNPCVRQITGVTEQAGGVLYC